MNVDGFTKQLDSRTQALVINIQGNGNYDIFEANNGRCGWETIKSSYDARYKSNIDLTRYFHVDSVIAHNNGDLTLHGFHSFNTAYELVMKSDKSNGSNIVFNCSKDPSYFGNVICKNINSLHFNGAKIVSINNIYSENTKPISVTDDYNTELEIRNTNLPKMKNGLPLLADSGLNNVRIDCKSKS